MEILKNFVVFEGIDGSGTTTQLDILEKFVLQNQNRLPSFHITFEPTNGSIGKLIRLSLRKEIVLDPKTTAFLFAADRNEHLFSPGGIAEHCNNGKIVVSDRYFPSSLVYQGITCGDELAAMVNKCFPGPELLLFFDIDPETAEKRIAGRPAREIYEYLDFQINVRKRYKALIPQLAEKGVRVEVIDASKTKDEVASQVWRAIEKMPIFKR
jgi:dTMP kinase